MSDDRIDHGHARGHDRDPDPAALDELRRAFADDDGGSGEVATTPAHVDPPAVIATAPPDGADRDSSAPGDPSAVIATAPPDGADRDTPAHVDPSAVIATAPPDGADRDSPAHVDPPAVVATAPPDGADRDTPAPADDAGPAILSADLPDIDRPRGDDPFDVVIVEQEPMPADDPTPPRIIRIDDYSGSTELPRDTRSVEPERAATPPSVAVPGEPIGPDLPRSDVDPDVISISDDDLPDTVYVEGTLERDGSGTIVFIEDDDTGDTLAPESERDLRRGIEPRMRERRVAVKRAQGRRRLKRFGLVAAVVLLVVAVLAVLGSPLFAVRADDVQVFNAVYTDPVELQAIIDDVVGTPVLRVDTTDVEDRIEEIPWVEAASVRTDFPHGLVVEIREREAISTYQGPDGRFRVLDREGRVLDVLELYPYAYVLIGGPESVDLSPGEFAPQGYAAASELAKNLTASVRGRVTLIEVTADGSRLEMTLDDGSTVFFGEARDLLAKLVRLEAVLANGQEREPGLIDVSTADVTR